MKTIEPPELSPRQMTELAASVAERVAEILDAKRSEPTLLDTQQLASRLGISVSGITRLTKAGKIPKIKINGLVKYSLSETLAALKKLN